MSRPPFDISIPSPWVVTRSNGNPVSSGTHLMGFRAFETTAGSSGHKQAGWLPPKGYNLTYLSYRRAQGICRNIPTSGPSNLGQIYTGCVGGSRFNSLDHFNAAMLESAITDNTLYNRVLINARLKMKAKSVDLGVAFAERKQTARLLGDTASRMARSFNNLKRGRVRAAMRDLGIASSRREPRGNSIPSKWLEMQYGWKPLISDVYGACDALSRRDKGDWRVTAKAQLNSRKEGFARFTSFDAGQCVAWSETGAFCRIDALPGNDLTMSLASLGITNPLLIAWELVPYSFVVDWCLPVGTWLDSLDALLGYKNASQSISVFTKAEWVETGSSLPPSGGFKISNEYVGSKKMVVLDRDAGSATLPTFPRIKDPRSLGHMANGLALLSQAFGRR